MKKIVNHLLLISSMLLVVMYFPVEVSAVTCNCTISCESPTQGQLGSINLDLQQLSTAECQQYTSAVGYVRDLNFANSRNEIFQRYSSCPNNAWLKMSECNIVSAQAQQSISPGSSCSIKSGSVKIADQTDPGDTSEQCKSWCSYQKNSFYQNQDIECVFNGTPVQFIETFEEDSEIEADDGVVEFEGGSTIGGSVSRMSSCRFNDNCIDVVNEDECKEKAEKEKYEFKQGESCLISPELQQQIQSLNKLGNITPEVLIGNVIAKALTIIGSIALLMFVYGGFVYMTARGNSDKAGEAIKILTWTALGMVAILSSYVLLKFVLDALG